MKLQTYRAKLTGKMEYKKTDLSIKHPSLLKRLQLLIQYSDTRLLEAFLGLFSFLWGCYMLLPVESYSGATIFFYLKDILPEWTLGVSMTSAGIFSVLSAAGSFDCGRRCVLLLNHLLWMFLAAFAFIGNYTSPAVCTYSSISAALMYLFLRSPVRRSK